MSSFLSSNLLFLLSPRDSRPVWLKGSIASDYFTDTELRSESSQCFYFFHSLNIGCNYERKFSSLNSSFPFCPTQIYGRISTWFSHLRESFWKLAQHPCDFSLFPLSLSLSSLIVHSFDIEKEKEKFTIRERKEGRKWMKILAIFGAQEKNKEEEDKCTDQNYSALRKIYFECNRRQWMKIYWHLL